MLNNLGERLRRCRTDRKMTQEQLAECAGTTQAVIQKIENGKSVRPRKIEGIAKACKTTPEYLMYGVEEDGFKAAVADLIEKYGDDHGSIVGGVKELL